MGSTTSTAYRLHVHGHLDVRQRWHHGDVWSPCATWWSQRCPRGKLADLRSTFQSRHCMHLPLRCFLCTYDVSCWPFHYSSDFTNIFKGSRLMDLPTGTLPSPSPRQGCRSLHLRQLDLRKYTVPQVCFPCTNSSQRTSLFPISFRLRLSTSSGRYTSSLVSF